MSRNNQLTYHKVGDYNIPNLILPHEEANIKLGKWGMLHKNYLQKHKPVVFTTLLTQGELWQYLADIDNQASTMFDILVEQMKQKENITEQLKEENQMEWIRQINNIQALVQEVVCTELIFA
jgi:hypothetical protein